MLPRIKRDLLRLVTICILLVSLLVALFVMTSSTALASSKATATSNGPAYRHCDRHWHPGYYGWHGGYYYRDRGHMRWHGSYRSWHGGYYYMVCR